MLVRKARINRMKQLVCSVTLKDCRVDTFRSGGKGGQNQNKRDTGVRITHLASGAVGESREERSQLLNKRSAFRKMAESAKFKLWVKMSLSKTILIEAKVDALMSPKHLRTEVHDEEGRWRVIDCDSPATEGVQIT